MFEGIHVVDEQAVRKYIKEHGIPMSEILDLFRKELLAADIEPNIRLSLYQYSECDDPKHLKLCLEGIVPNDLDVDYVCHTEDDIVVSVYSQLNFFGQCIISLVYGEDDVKPE